MRFLHDEQHWERQDTLNDYTDTWQVSSRNQFSAMVEQGQKCPAIRRSFAEQILEGLRPSRWPDRPGQVSNTRSNRQQETGNPFRGHGCPRAGDGLWGN